MEECGLRMYENRLLRTFVKRNGGTGGWRKLHNGELHNVHCSLNIIM
jgi:hypothetical protein